jgi:hypothetical protein
MDRGKKIDVPKTKKKKERETHTIATTCSIDYYNSRGATPTDSLKKIDYYNSILVEQIS